MPATAADMAFFALGTAVVLVALFKPFKRGPIILTNDKLGHINIDFVAFLVIVGIAIAATGAYFRWQGYEKRLEEFDTKAQTLNTEIGSLRLQVDQRVAELSRKYRSEGDQDRGLGQEVWKGRLGVPA